MGTRLGDRAVVLWRSMAGLLAARVLADAYAEVTVLDRDELTAHHMQRREAPRGRHVHVLLSRGQRVLDALFPGLTAELTANSSSSSRTPRYGWSHSVTSDRRKNERGSTWAMRRAGIGSHPFVRAFGLVYRPDTLLRPGVALRVLRRPAPAGPPQHSLVGQDARPKDSPVRADHEVLR